MDGYVTLCKWIEVCEIDRCIGPWYSHKFEIIWMGSTTWSLLGNVVDFSSSTDHQFDIAVAELWCIQDLCYQSKKYKLPFFHRLNDGHSIKEWGEHGTIHIESCYCCGRMEGSIIFLIIRNFNFHILPGYLPCIRSLVAAALSKWRFFSQCFNWMMKSSTVTCTFAHITDLNIHR